MFWLHTDMLVDIAGPRWNCQYCKFLNHPLMTRCEFCDRPKRWHTACVCSFYSSYNYISFIVLFISLNHTCDCMHSNNNSCVFSRIVRNFQGVQFLHMGNLFPLYRFNFHWCTQSCPLYIVESSLHGWIHKKSKNLTPENFTAFQWTVFNWILDTGCSCELDHVTPVCHNILSLIELYYFHLWEK